MIEAGVVVEHQAAGAARDDVFHPVAVLAIEQVQVAGENRIHCVPSEQFVQAVAECRPADIGQVGGVEVNRAGFLRFEQRVSEKDESVLDRAIPKLFGQPVQLEWIGVRICAVEEQELAVAGPERVEIGAKVFVEVE